MRDQISRPYKTRSEIIVLCILISEFLERIREGKGFQTVWYQTNHNLFECYSHYLLSFRNIWTLLHFRKHDELSAFINVRFSFAYLTTRAKLSMRW
jgi:hypothetical protein